MDLLAAENEFMTLEKLESVEEHEREEVVPVPPLPDAIANTGEHGRAGAPDPNEAQDAHVTVLVVGLLLLLARLEMGLVVTGRYPRGGSPKETILDGHEVRVLLEREHVVDVEVVVDTGPKTEDNRGVDQGGDGEEAVVPKDEVRVEPHEERSGKIADKDHESGR